MRYHGYGIDPSPILQQADLAQLSNKMIAEGAKLHVNSVYRWRKNINKMSVYAAENLCYFLEIPFRSVYPEAHNED